MYYVTLTLYGGQMIESDGSESITEAELIADQMSAFTDVSMVEVSDSHGLIVYRVYC